MLTLDVGRSEEDSNGKAALAVGEVVDLTLDAFPVWLSELTVSNLRAMRIQFVAPCICDG